jgi:hypothetical protein
MNVGLEVSGDVQSGSLGVSRFAASRCRLDAFKTPVND